MWEFIKYCFLMVISASFGNNPEGVTFKNTVVGIITMFVLIGLALGVLWLIGIIVKKYRHN